MNTCKIDASFHYFFFYENQRTLLMEALDKRGHQEDGLQMHESSYKIIDLPSIVSYKI